MEQEPHPIPHTIVMSAGIGGTSPSWDYRGYSTQLVVVDPESSVFFDYYYSRDESLCVDASGRIEDIDRPSGRAFISSGRG